MCAEVGVKFIKEVFMIDKYVGERQKFFECMAEVDGASADDWKQKVLALMFFGKPQDDNPVMWTLSFQMQKGAEMLLYWSRYHRLTLDFTSRPSPSASAHT